MPLLLECQSNRLLYFTLKKLMSISNFIMYSKELIDTYVVSRTLYPEGYPDWIALLKYLTLK